jgi:hypothetical protein
VEVESWTFNAPCVCGLYFLAKAGVSVAEAGVFVAKVGVSMAKAGVFPLPSLLGRCFLCQIPFLF